MLESRKLESITSPDAANGRARQWYRQAAGAALVAGASALTASPNEAAGGTVTYEVNQTIGADVQTSPGWQIQVLYFDFFTGNTLVSPIWDTWIEDSSGGHGLPTTEMLPEGFQFGVARVGGMNALFGLAPQSVQAVKHQAMVNVVHSGYTNTENNVYYAWTLLQPMKLLGGAVIGNNPAFVPAPPRSWETGLHMQTMAPDGEWTTPTPGFLGLKFSADEGSNFYYGWAEVTVNSDKTVTLHRFGYNDQLNEPIEAGGNALIPGDATRNGIVDGDDYVRWADHFSLAGTWDDGDFNLDGVVNGDDYVVWADHFDPQELELLGFNEMAAMRIAAVPEPASISLLLMGAAGLSAYRARRSKKQKDAAS